MLTAHGATFGQPPGAEPEQLQLIAPWEPLAREWKNIQWIDRDNRHSNTEPSRAAGLVREKSRSRPIEMS